MLRDICHAQRCPAGLATALLCESGPSATALSAWVPATSSAVAHQLPAACTGITASGACAPAGGTASAPSAAPASDTTSATGAQLAQQLTEQAAQLAAVQARLQAAEAARSRLKRQLAQREAVIGELARNRNNSTYACLQSFDHARQEALHRCFRTAGSLGAQRQKYIQLVSDVEDLVSALEAAPSDGISATASAASARVFEAAAEIGTVRGEAAHYQAEAEELFVELQEYKCGLEQERGRVEYFQGCANWEAGARVAAEHRAQAAEAAAAAERAAHQFTRQQLKQVRPLCCAWSCASAFLPSWLPGCLRMQPVHMPTTPSRRALPCHPAS